MPNSINDASTTAQLVIASRVAIAALCGSVIGWERWMAGKFAGIRTHAVVAIASGLACAGTQLLTGDNSESARILAAIFTGVGFIGAGAILQTKHQMLGITTAATVLLAATIGAIAGLGLPVLAGVSTIGSILALRLFGWIYFHFDSAADEDLPVSKKSKEPPSSTGGNGS